MILSVFDKRDALNLIKIDFNYIKRLNKNFFNNKDFMLDAIMINSHSIKFLSHELRCNIDFLKTAIPLTVSSLDSSYRFRFTDVNHTIRNNRLLIVLILKYSLATAIQDLKYIKSDIRENKEVKKHILTLYFKQQNNR